MRTPFALPFFLLLLIAAPTQLPGQGAPAVNINQALQSTAPGRRMGVSETVIMNDAEGEFVGYNDLLGELKGHDARAVGEWDHLGGILRLEAGGHEFRILKSNSSMFIDNVFRPVPKKLRVGRAGLPQIPIETVAAVMRAIDPASVPETTPAAAAGTPSNPSEMSASVPAVPAAALGGLVNPPTESAQLPPPDAPKTGKAPLALEWRLLADEHHHRVPARVTIVCDGELAPLADRLKTLTAASLQASCTVIRSTGRRSGPGLLDQVKGTGPDLVIDLMRAGAGEAGLRGAQAARTIEVWAVHEALWPQGSGGEESAYVNHQIHNLALGSMIHKELSKSYLEYTISFTLSPAYLLRRVNAPSAAILVPESMTGKEGTENDALARAIAGGMQNYTIGLRQALNAR